MELMDYKVHRDLKVQKAHRDPKEIQELTA